MNHLEFLEDTIAFYSVDPKGRRAVNDTGHCKYRIFDKNDNKVASCAIGRYIPDDKYKPDLEGEFIQKMQIKGIISPKIRGLENDFLVSVQRLHDGKHFWDENGLTPAGEERAEELRERAKELDEQNN